MYTKPWIMESQIDTTEHAACCTVSAPGQRVNTGACGGNGSPTGGSPQPFPTCELPIGEQFCTITVGPVTVSGNPPS